MLLARRRHRSARHGGRDQHAASPQAPALRVVAPPAPVRLPRGRARPAPPALDRPGVPEQPTRDALLVVALDRRRRRNPVVPPRDSALSHPAAQHSGLRGRAGERRGRLGLDDRPRPAPPPRRRRASSSSGGSCPAPAGRARHPYSLSAAPTSDTLRITVKDLGDDSRELEGLRPGTRVVIEGPVRPAARRGADAAQGHPARERHRHHPVARTARAAAARPRRRDAHLSGSRRAGPRLPRGA